MPQERIFEMKNMTKKFPGVLAVSDVDFYLVKGEVLALVGENGAGKSTLMNLVLGSIQPTSGHMLYKGKPFAPKNPEEALNKGISMIHQELKLVPEMSISENIWLGQEKKFLKRGLIEVKKRDEATRKLLSELKIEVNPRAKIKTLSVAEMQLVEIARAVSYKSEIIIMDEPTSSLTNKEIDMLYSIVESLVETGMSVVFITHKLDEVFRICDDVMVMRDGKYIDRQPVKDLTSEQIIAKMVGRDLTNLYPKQKTEIREVALEVKNLTRKGYFEDISFSVRKGEILGFSGLVKAGRSEVMECIFGIERPDSGQIYLNREEVQVKSTQEAINYGMAMITEDRLRRGLIHMHSVKYNLSLAYLPTITKRGFVDRKQEEEDCQLIKEATGIKASSLNQLGGQLSGGNQQKVIIAKWLLTKSDIIIFDEPTRGIDVGSKAEIYKIMGNLASEGKAIIMVSSELPEVMAISDRMIIMAHGKKMAELDRKEYDENTIMQYAFGYRKAQ